MDVEAPAAPRWRKRMQPITHTRQRRSYFQPLLLGSPPCRKRGPVPSAVFIRALGEPATPPPRSQLDFSHAGAIVAFMLVFLGWYESVSYTHLTLPTIYSV